VRIESSGLIVQLRPRHGGAAWDLDCNEFIKALTEAKSVLSNVDTSVIV